MTSILEITTVENLQVKITQVIKSFNNIPGIYVSLNKTQKSTEELLSKSKINVDRLFFIDCVTTEKSREDVIHLKPNNLEMLSEVISTFIKNIKGDRFIIIDALSTLLIYNSENDVAKFIKEVTEYASSNNVEVVAFSPKTQGEELLKKIFNFFDEVRK